MVEEEDAFWKEVLEALFEHFIGLFFPALHAAVDWSEGVRSRDKELSRLQPDNVTGVRFVDKLMEVRLCGGESALLMIHVEVQSHPDSAFAHRMWTYWYRLVDRYGENVVSLALLADDAAHWRPNRHQAGSWGCTVQFDFPVVKLLDYRTREEELVASTNPFALLVLALLKAQDLAGKDQEVVQARGTWKLQAFRSLYDRGWGRAEIRHVFRFLDWIVRLPAAMDDQLHVELTKTEGGKDMTYITSFERYGMRKGMKKGLEQGKEKGRLENAQSSILEVLEVRFGVVPPAMRDHIGQLTDLEACKSLLRHATSVASLEDFSLDLNSD